MLVKIDDPSRAEMYVPGVTIKLSGTPGRVGLVPTPGQHTDDVLRGVLGYDAATIEKLRRLGVVSRLISELDALTDRIEKPRAILGINSVRPRRATRHRSAASRRAQSLKMKKV